MDCPVCKASAEIGAAHELYDRCSSCGVVYQAREIKAVEDYYSEIDRVPDFSHQVGSYHDYLGVMAEHDLVANGENIIDIGSGDGRFLQMATERFAAEGFAVESSQIARRLLTEKGINVIEMEDVRALQRKVVVALQVLEHVAEPLAFLESMGLEKGDRLLMTSPAVDSVYFRRYGRRWKSYSPSHHLVLYSQRGVETLFEKAGLELLDYRLCISATNGLGASLWKYLRNSVQWPLRILVRGFVPPPLFYYRNSFLVIGKKR